MSADTNRLREAAAVSTAYGIWADGPGRRGKTSVSQQVADLLRAVAEYHPVECSFARYGHVCTPYCPRCRAEALADTILGVES